MYICIYLAPGLILPGARPYSTWRQAFFYLACFGGVPLAGPHLRVILLLSKLDRKFQHSAGKQSRHDT